MGKETLHSKNGKEEILASTKIKGEVREPKRLTLYDENIAGARLSVCKVHGKCGGDGAPISSGERTMTHPKNGFLKVETTKRYGDRNSQYGGNRSRRLNSHCSKKIEMTKNAKSMASRAGRGLALTKSCQKSKCAKIL